jgi:large subunit ribosomal protein L3
MESKHILAKKLGMTQVFGAAGVVIPVTVLQAGPCFVMQIKTMEKDGYNAIKVGFGDKRKNLVSKPAMGEFKKAEVQPKQFVREFRVEDTTAFSIGQEIKCDVFSAGEIVDATAQTKGRGTTGVIQRWNQHRGPMAHGSGYHRGVGSMGAHTEPSRVFKNKHMAGHYGNEQVTIKNLEVVKIDAEKGVILIKGGIPGAEGGLVILKTAKSAIKKGGKK